MMIKHESKSTGPKDTVSRVYNKQGGIMGTNSLGELPRNCARWRSSDMAPSLCSKKSFRDPLFMVMEQCTLQDGEDKFVRTVTACPEYCPLINSLMILCIFAQTPMNFVCFPLTQPFRWEI